MQHQTTAVTIHLNDDLCDRIERAAAIGELSVNDLVEGALTRHLAPGAGRVGATLRRARLDRALLLAAGWSPPTVHPETGSD